MIATSSSHPSTIYIINWEKANYNLYYDLTRVMSETVMRLLDQFDADLLYVDSSANNLCRVKAIYDLIVSEVHSASLAVIPDHKKGY